MLNSLINFKESMADLGAMTLIGIALVFVSGCASPLYLVRKDKCRVADNEYVCPKDAIVQVK